MDHRNGNTGTCHEITMDGKGMTINSMNRIRDRTIHARDGKGRGRARRGR